VVVFLDLRLRKSTILKAVADFSATKEKSS